MGMIVCGLDCGKQSVSACITDTLPGNLKRFAQTYKPIKVGFHKHELEALASEADLFAIEPTGVYYKHFYRVLTDLGKETRLVSPKRVRNYAEYHGLRNKSDRLDPAAIACFTLENIGNDSAFLSYAGKELKELLSHYRSQRKRLSALKQRLDQALCLEFPEVVKVHGDSDRDWLDTKVPALWRYLAGEPCHNQKTRDRQLSTTSGLGLSERTRDLARDLIAGEQSMAGLEQDLFECIYQPDFKVYNQALDLFNTAPSLRGELIAVWHPFDRFLENGAELREYVYGDKTQRKGGRTKRNRSMDRFKLYNGLGRVQIESGTSHEWKPGGSARIRAAWYLLVDCCVVKNRPKEALAANPKIIAKGSGDRPWANMAILEPIADQHGVSWQQVSAWVHYENLKRTHPVDTWRRSLVAGRCCKMVYRELVRLLA